MPNIPLVSVIVPVYNVDRYIDRCLKSIVNQTYLNTEIILVDDGATDDSSKICEQYAMLDERIKIVSQLNQGQSAARNRALDIATGEYVVFVDSDDYIHDHAIQILMDGIHEFNADITIGDYYVQIDELTHCDQIGSIAFQSVGKDIAYNNLFSERHMMYGCVWGKIFKESIFTNNRFPEGRVYEDTYLITDLYHTADSIAVTDCKLYYYLTRENSTSRRWNDGKIEDSLFATYRRIHFFDMNGNRDLLQMAVDFHLQHAINSYNRVGSKYEAKRVRQYFRDAFVKYRKYISDPKEKFLYVAFCLSPALYTLLTKIYAKLSK